jgi:hypothetical protein
VPVILFYLTALPALDGEFHALKDIYGRDQAVLKELNAESCNKRNVFMTIIIRPSDTSLLIAPAPLACYSRQAKEIRNHLWRVEVMRLD